MEDDKIKDLFRNFAPEISPDNQFLAQLRRNMDAFMLLLPTAVSWLSTIKFSLPILGLQALTPDWQIIGWIVAAFLSATTAINAYEIAITRLKPYKVMR